jgi:hypothetical protein
MPDQFGKRRKCREVSVRVFPTDDEIAERAYEILRAEGNRLDRLRECWRRAEQELLDRAASRVLR